MHGLERFRAQWYEFPMDVPPIRSIRLKPCSGTLGSYKPQGLRAKPMVICCPSHVACIGVTPSSSDYGGIAETAREASRDA